MFACRRWLRPQGVNFMTVYSETLAVYPCIRTIRLSAARSYGASMRAWVINRYGPNDVLAFTENHPAPSVNFAHEVVVQVHAASLNPLDISMRGGYGAGVLRLRRDPRTLLQRGSEFPLVLGRDMSGVVVECGSGVTHVQVGDEVWASVPPWQQGSFAECVLLNGSDVSLKPKALSHVEAASIPYAAATAWSALVTTGGLNSENCSNKRVLVHGASGGVGTLSIQLLKAWGGHVTATCFEDGVRLVEELGADDIIDCSAADTASQLRTRQKFDLILDNVGGDTDSWAMDLLKPWSGSKFVTLVSPLLRNTDSLGLVDGVLQSGMTLHDKAIRSVIKGVFYRWAFYVPDGVALDRIGEMVTSGKIRPVVETTYPFSQVPEAFRKVEAGQALGKTVITVATEEAEPSSSQTDFYPPAATTHDTHTPHTHADGHMTSPQTHAISAVMSELDPALESVQGQTGAAGLVDQGQLETSSASGEDLQHPTPAQEVVQVQEVIQEVAQVQEVVQEVAQVQEVIQEVVQEVAQVQEVVQEVAQVQEVIQEVVQEVAQVQEVVQVQEVSQVVAPSTGAQPAEEVQGTLAQPAEPAAAAAAAAAQAKGLNQHTECVHTGHR